MICKKCGNQLNNDALFCPKCGQKTEIQVQGINRNVQSNAYNVNSAGNVESGTPPKKKHTVRTVLLSIAGTIVVMFGGLMWLGSQASNSVETGSSAVSAPSGHSEISSEVPSQPGEISSEVPSQDAVNDTVSSQESIDELLGYIDQASDLVINMSDDVNKLTETDATREAAGYAEKAYLELADLQKQADSISGLDAALVTVKKEYFDMLCNACKTLYEMGYFAADSGDFVDNFMVTMPIMQDYASIQDYYNDLYSWYQSAKEGYEAVTFCPPCMENEWKQLGDALDLNESIVEKLYWAAQDNDYLRLHSAMNMSNRYLAILGVRMDKLIMHLETMGDNFSWQLNFVDGLMDEIYEYADLEEKDRKEYQFTDISDEIALDYEAVDTIYPSLYNTYDAFLIIKTNCASGNRKILVEAEIPGFTQKYQESFTLDAAYRAIYIKPPALTGDLDLTSAKDAQISVTVSDQDGTIIETKSFPITIKSKYDVEWRTDEYGVATKDNILCYLTPEASAISELKRGAIDEMSAMTGGRMEAFVGYQETGFNHYVGTYLQAAGIMRALYETGVRYNADSFSLSGSHQHVLFPADVLNQKSGLCIETSLTVASALQSAGMHAFLVFPPGHAQVAVEIWNGRGEDAHGTGEYFLIETTALSSNSNNRNIFIDDANALLDRNVLNSSPIRYMNAEEWYEYLSVDGTYVIDCDDSRVLGLTPFAN